MTDGALELLGIAGEIARTRGAQDCSTKDLALAAVVYRRVLLAREIDIDVVEPDNRSPEMLPMSPQLQQSVAGQRPDSLDVDELVALAAEHNPDLADYLR
ncbi:hypothetical protein [Streptomyces sp. H27-D2]|uniref:hypothetical protein n=1 Tax=Streptomyces sp. H27-D2 TaxID=3046304 RepID=UPI002DBC7314|nr:hypothetical protein [Streptomyces sp. H27-D2]MEC4019849.1 hypothetical protein [Streptomyces sp. H27-D2]